MRKGSAIFGSLLFLFLAPGFVAGVLPWWITHWQRRRPLLGIPQVRVLGILVALAGISLVLESFARFALRGLGTPAPIAPTRHLVSTGLYRFVRNPMYLGVLSAIFGQGLFFGDARLFLYAAALWIGFHLFVVAYEEPKLHRTFGNEYQTFSEHVPRWIPRLRPWQEHQSPHSA